MSEFHLIVPEWCESATATDWLGNEAKVIRIPAEEFADPDFTVSADDFPRCCPQCGGDPEHPASDPVNGPRVPCCDPVHRGAT